MTGDSVRSASSDSCCHWSNLDHHDPDPCPCYGRRVYRHAACMGGCCTVAHDCDMNSRDAYYTTDPHPGIPQHPSDRICPGPGTRDRHQGPYFQPTPLAVKDLQTAQRDCLLPVVVLCHSSLDRVAACDHCCTGKSVQERSTGYWPRCTAESAARDLNCSGIAYSLDDCAVCCR